MKRSELSESTMLLLVIALAVVVIGTCVVAANAIDARRPLEVQLYAECMRGYVPNKDKLAQQKACQGWAMSAVRKGADSESRPH